VEKRQTKGSVGRLFALIGEHSGISYWETIVSCGFPAEDLLVQKPLCESCKIWT